MKKHQGFYSSEFEFAIGLIALIILIYWLLKISEKNNGVADEIDRLINKFVVGVISQEDAYRKYILIMYGFSAYQTIENDLEEIRQTLENEIDYYSKTMYSFSKLLDKIKEISKLGVPAVVDTEFSAVIDDYSNASALFSNLITQADSIMQEIKDKYFCRKYGGLCLNYNCTQRKDPMSLKYKLHRKVQFIFKSIQQRINFIGQK